MGRVVASIVGGFTLGGIYTLLALGLVFAFRATRVFNFAQGQLLLFPAMIVGYMQLNGRSVALALVVAFGVSAVVGALFYMLVLRRTVGLPLFTGVVATFGLSAILSGIIGIMFKGNNYNINLYVLPHGSVQIGGIGVSTRSLTVMAFSMLLSLAVAGGFKYTHLGLKVRAAGQDAVLAAQSGIQVRRLYAGSWVLCAVLAAVAGILYGSTTTVTIGLAELGLAALPAIVLGGMDSIEGCLIGGILIGLLRGFTLTFLGGPYADLLTYSVLLVVLLVLPQGLFGTKHVVRA